MQREYSSDSKKQATASISVVDPKFSGNAFAIEIQGLTVYTDLGYRRAILESRVVLQHRMESSCTLSQAISMSIDALS